MAEHKRLVRVYHVGRPRGISGLHCDRPGHLADRGPPAPGKQNSLQAYWMREGRKENLAD